MKRRTSKRQTTPKKSNKSSTTTPKKKSSKASTSKKTPKKPLIGTRSPRSRILPKSPISDSMKQLKINDFFKSVSLQTPSTSETTLSESKVCPKPLEVLKPESSTTRKRGTKTLLKNIKPVFSPQKRYGLRNANPFVKRLKFETNDSLMKSSDEIQIIEINEELMDTSNGDTLKLTSNESSKLSQTIENTNKSINDSKNLDQMMNELKIKSPIVCGKSSLNLNDKIVNQLYQNIDNSLEEDIDLMPVFRKPKVPKSKQNSKENINKYVDTEKEKKMSYFLKNLSRLKKDKEILAIQPFEEIETDLINDKNEQLVTKSSFLIKPFKGIDTFCDFISKQFKPDFSEQTIEIDLSEFYKKLFEIPLNRLLPLIPILSKKVKEYELEALLSHIINLVLNEENLLICSQSEHKIEELFTENNYEISLSLILKDFYRILSRISKNLNDLTQNQIDCNEINTETQRLLFFMSNFLRIMTLVFNKCSFKIEAIDSDKEFTKLLISGFALGLDYRIIKSSDQLIEIKKFIGVILKHLCVDEFKANSIIESLISFCDSDQKTDISLSLQIASLFPMNIEFDLKRKFCISIIQLFVPKVLNKFELNFNGIHDILHEIEWKGLSTEDIYIIIQMIGLSMDLPEDLINHKETIGSVLSTLDNKINSSIPKSSELEFTEIHKLLMILRSKVNVSTKRF